MESDFGELIRNVAVAGFVIVVAILVTEFIVKEVRKRKRAKLRAEQRDNREFLNWLAMQSDAAIWQAKGKDYAWWTGLSDPVRAMYRREYYALADKRGPEWWK